MSTAFSPAIATALDAVARDKAGFLPPYLNDAELADLLAAWTRLYTDPTVKLSNQRFIVDPKLYGEPAFARLATHPVVQEVVRRVIGPFQLAGYAVVATPPNGTTPSTPQTTPFHVDHCVYSDVPVNVARDTFVCVWVNFEALAMENGPFALAVGTDKWNIGWEFFKARPGLEVKDMGWDRLAAYNTGPAGSTAIYSGKTWHSATTNCSQVVRKGLNMNFVPAQPLDSLRRNFFDACALERPAYDALAALIGIPGYLIAHDPAKAAEARQQAAPKDKVY